MQIIVYDKNLAGPTGAFVGRADFGVGVFVCVVYLEMHDLNAPTSSQYPTRSRKCASYFGAHQAHEDIKSIKA